jgi:hypothetical protein
MVEAQRNFARYKRARSFYKGWAVFYLAGQFIHRWISPSQGRTHGVTADDPAVWEIISGKLLRSGQSH